MTARNASTPPTDSHGVRTRLVQALKLDLVGPGAGDDLAEERLPYRDRPANYYLTGFLIPSGTPPERRADADEDDDMSGEIPALAGLSEESSEERRAAKKGFFPSSMGLSFLVAKESGALDVIVRWGDYTLAETGGERDPKENAPSSWQRHPREAALSLPLRERNEPAFYDVPDSGGLQLCVVERTIAAEELKERIPQGTRSVSVFLVNHRKPVTLVEREPDVAYVFQPELEVRCNRPFVPRPDLRSVDAADWDEQVADLHYADTPEYVTGHGISAEWEIVDGACRLIRTAWMPSGEVESTATADVQGVELSMDALGKLAEGPAAYSALSPMLEQYRIWIGKQESSFAGLGKSRRETAEELLRLAGVAADRMERGIALLKEDLGALDAFRMANRAVARALRKRLGLEAPCWRPFQLAFLLLNLSGLANPRDPDRETVDLLFFPTGGGKTEAYLGLAAFAMVMRRLRHSDETGLAGAGVSVIMRYTLRLLTLDQLARAAGLVCALELERAENEARYGKWPFEIGLWVGKAATPNVLGYKGDGNPDSARTKVRQFKSDPRGKPSPIPLETCPWCGKRFGPESFALLDDKDRANDDYPTQLRIVCVNFECDFARRGLPIQAVDEPLYRRLPAFLIATVDKFASLPWVGKSGVLLGGADRADKRGFFGAAEPGKGRHLQSPLPPPDLVIQDELHLISGPLGTMAGLYEAAIEALCVRETDGRNVRPKIVASTATVRRAQDQIQALFARSLTQVFPPPGPNRRDSFFAQTVPASAMPARLYLGIASQGRSPKVMMRKVWLALMGAAERLYRDAGGHDNRDNPVDPYMTVLGYFNSLRELGGARRILEEEIQSTVKFYGGRKRIGQEHGLFQNRKTFSEVVELTSRVPTNEVAEARRRLGIPFHDIKQRVDCAIATNMISVGLDIPRLGLMVVLGQPKSHSEYIQATSRVGRSEDRPGLIVTLLNVHKPRDRSHYERFRHYHETFYRSVEVGSVTPFSARALDRGFAAAMVTLARHSEPRMTPPEGVGRIAEVRAELEQRLRDAFFDRVRRQPFAEEAEREERLRSIQLRIGDLLDSWRKIVQDYRNSDVAVQYQRYELKRPRPLLREILDKDFESDHHQKFRANRSLRDVEPDVNLFLKDLSGIDVGDET